jgi:hypothetical protein
MRADDATETGWGAFVIPYDVSHALGGGNAAIGKDILAKALGTGPFGLPLMPKPYRWRKEVRGIHYAKGGKVPYMDDQGNVTLSPEKVAEIGGGHLHIGHKILSRFVSHVRREHKR